MERTARNRRFLALPAAVLTALVLAAPAAQAAPGSLDVGFGSAGTQITAIDAGAMASDLALQPDGKIVAVGRAYLGKQSLFSVVRYNANGSLDAAFGAGGKVLTAFGKTNDYANAVLVQPTDGKILAAGSTFVPHAAFAFALARYNRNGSLDTAFGNGGRMTTVIGDDDYFADVALQPDGKIVGVGGTYGDSGYSFAVVRYNASGSLDKTFGAGGERVVSFGSTFDEATAVALQPDGKIVVAGHTGRNPNSRVALMRLTPAGALDTTFGRGGKVVANLGPQAWANDVALQSDGKIVVGGFSGAGSQSSFAVFRFRPNGTLDPTFGSNGAVATSFGGTANLSGVAVQPTGKIVAVGTSEVPDQQVAAVVRYLPTGALDTGFGNGGKVTTAFPGFAQYKRVVIQRDAKIVAAGSVSDSMTTRYALARYLGAQ